MADIDPKRYKTLESLIDPLGELEGRTDIPKREKDDVTSFMFDVLKPTILHNQDKLYELVEYTVHKGCVKFVSLMLDNFNLDLKRVMDMALDKEGLQENGRGPDYLHPERAGQIVQLLIDKGLNDVDGLLVEFLSTNGFTGEELYYTIIQVLILNGAKLTPKIMGILSTFDLEIGGKIFDLFTQKKME